MYTRKKESFDIGKMMKFDVQITVLYISLPLDIS